MNNLWHLPQLLKESGITVGRSVPDLPVVHVTDDSRQVTKNTLFVAVKGSQEDGHRFLRQAVEQGACAVLVDRTCAFPENVVAIRVASTRSFLGPLVSTFFQFPSRRLKMVGITGTNGKTTTAYLTQYLLEQSGVPAGLMGTVVHRWRDKELSSGNTTPGAVFLQATLSKMFEEGIRACVMEVSSHALDQDRVAGMEWTCGVFTNFSSEHLDYHSTLERYLKAKLRLFQALGGCAIAVINRDDPQWARVRRSTQAAVLTYSTGREADLTAQEVRTSLEGTFYQMKTPQGIFLVHSPLSGRHNVENLLAAAGVLVGLKVPLRMALERLADFPGVPGRLERIEEGQSFPVFVDYAHTDGALEQVLTQLRGMTDKKILVVFGCGGDRDKTKRPRMGQVAAQFSDRIIITSDNPRSEDPEMIARQVAQGTQGTTTPCGIILDRREAIQVALESANEGWVVLIAGKGHETGQILQDRVIPFDDRSVARELLRDQAGALRG